MISSKVAFSQEEIVHANDYLLHYVVNVFTGEQLLSRLKIVLKNPNVSLNQKDLLGNTAIHIIIDKIPLSAKKQFYYNAIGIKAIKMLIEAGADRDFRNYIGEMPLHIAVKKGDTLLPQETMQKGNLIAFLISEGAVIEAETIDGNTPLHLAAAFGQANTVKYLISCNINRNPQNKDKNTPLHYAVLVKSPHPRFMHNPVQVVNVLVKQGGVDLHMKNNQEYTPIQILEILLKKDLVTSSSDHIIMKDILLNQGLFKEHDYYQSQASLDQLTQGYKALNIICTSTPTPWMIPAKTRSHTDHVNKVDSAAAHSGSIMMVEKRLN